MILPIQLKILVASSLIYLIWAVISHFRDKSLTSDVILEYFLTAVLVLILGLGFIL